MRHLIPASRLFHSSRMVGLAALLGLSTGVGVAFAEETTRLDCGVHALFVLLKLEGSPTSIDRLDAVLPPRRPDGYSMAELASAARALGLRLEGVRFSQKDEPLKQPAIALLEDARGGHFLVLRPVGSTGTMVQVIDPPHAPWIMDYDRLLAGPKWTGRLLVPRSP
jgi:ABC-type bacteriocin/lantibiotic exporter with double-glycine peptidase domain